MTYKGEPWHKECFTCSNCEKQLAGIKFTSKDDKPYCADCYGELFAKKCCRCNVAITGEFASVQRLVKLSRKLVSFVWECILFGNVRVSFWYNLWTASFVIVPMCQMSTLKNRQISHQMHRIVLVSFGEKASILLVQADCNPGVQSWHVLALVHYVWAVFGASFTVLRVYSEVCWIFLKNCFKCWLMRRTAAGIPRFRPCEERASDLFLDTHNS